MEKIIVKKSRNGFGLFANKRLKAGSTVSKIKGKVVHYKVLLKVGGTFQNNCFRYGPLTYLTPTGDITEFINHSCEPNCRIEKRDRKLYVVAVREIKPKEELTFDYSTILGDDDTWTMKCNCGTKSCRKVIKRFTSLPKDILTRYKAEKIIPSYILKLPL